MRSRLQPWLVVAALSAALLAGMHAQAEMSASDLTQLAQNAQGNRIGASSGRDHTTFTHAIHKGRIEAQMER